MIEWQYKYLLAKNGESAEKITLCAAGAVPGKPAWQAFLAYGGVMAADRYERGSSRGRRSSREYTREYEDTRRRARGSSGMGRSGTGATRAAARKRRSGIMGTVLLILLILLVAAGIALLLADILPISGGAKKTLQQAQEMADRYDYDSALATLRANDKFNSDTEMQAKAAEYEAAKQTMTGEIDRLLESARARILEFDYQGGIDLLKASPYYEYSAVLKTKAEEYEKALKNGGDMDQAKITEADRLAAMYDYDGALELIKGIASYEENPALQERAAGYEAQKAACVAISPENVTHIFYHSLVVDPSRAFNPGEEGYDGWQQWMTTISEFDKITQSMYDKGYVLVSIHDLITKTKAEDGTVTISPNAVYLPEGKKAYVLSLDDLCYYHTYDDHGVASKIVLDEEGKPTCEYIAADGTVSYGDYDAVPRLDTFLEEHPDGCYRGARGIIALTGYNGILGYRTDGAYSEEHNTNTDVYYADQEQIDWLAEHPGFDWEQECAEAKKVADAMKEDGWEFASHTWGHKAVGDATYDSMVSDTQRWMQYVSPLIGETDAIIFAHGQDISPTGAYDSSNEKYMYLKSQGFDIYCNVDSTPYTTSVTADYFHQGRRNLDGYRIYQDAYNDGGLTSDLFDALAVIDLERPLPVPDL